MQDISDSQLDYLNEGLRKGSAAKALLDIRPKPGQGILDDFTRFEKFFSAHANRPVTNADLYLTVAKKDLLKLFYYTDDRDRNCLILQSCFGLTKPLDQGGRIVLINKGNFQELAGRSDEELYFGDSVYRNPHGEVEFFQNLNLHWKIPASEAQQFLQNFNAIYSPRTPQKDPYIQGYLLPVRPFINLLIDRARPFDTGDVFTFRWGLTEPVKAGLGNLTLIIGRGNCTTGAVMAFRSAELKILGDNDCPPHTGCA